MSTTTTVYNIAMFYIWELNIVISLLLSNSHVFTELIDNKIGRQNYTKNSNLECTYTLYSQLIVRVLCYKAPYPSQSGGEGWAPAVIIERVLYIVVVEIT